jgi:ribonuclease BN (tRNA processing enzyme)
MVYASDVGYPDGGPTPEVLALYRGAHALVHDTTYTPALQATRRNRGFSSYEDAAAAAVAAGVQRLVMFHYDQDFTDAEVDALRTACRAALDARGGQAIELVAAAEGDELTV